MNCNQLKEYLDKLYHKKIILEEKLEKDVTVPHLILYHHYIDVKNKIKYIQDHYHVRCKL
jgi:hypothetical protein